MDVRMYVCRPFRRRHRCVRSLFNSMVPIYSTHQDGERHCEGEVSCPRTKQFFQPGLEIGPPDLETRALTMGPSRLPQSETNYFSQTNDTDNPVNQWKLEADICSWLKARESSCTQVTIGFTWTFWMDNIVVLFLANRLALQIQSQSNCKSMRIL